MRLRSISQARQRAEAGVEICTAHGPRCKKYPDHPLVRERNTVDMDLARMLGQSIGSNNRISELVDAGYEVPEEFTRGAEDPPQGERVRLFFDRYDLAKHFPSDESGCEPDQCRTRKLSDEEIRQRMEWAKEVYAARLKKNQPDPPPPWEGIDPETFIELAKMLGQYPYEGCPENLAFEERCRLKEEAEKAALIARLQADEELAAKLREAMSTWQNRPRRGVSHTQHNDASDFEEME
ncbi:hypothetical protein NC315_13555 [Streptomyces sp. G2]|uniref:hypothetical protein n=1 Tax=Streptomyces sp. G2 TaxID=1684471 RepID=UPI00202F99CB|nr:hypothetical protein [Streptomyces sp. G2]MCM1946396.1 hypothetical protein [Streptomyces sp. G2]